MLRAAREQWRRARSWPIARPLVEAADRAWWAHVIRRADIVDVEFVSAQVGRPLSARQAVRAYVRGGHAAGLTLNPLACEQTIARQLPEQDRVPALYAYLVNSRGGMDLSPNWDAAAYDDRHPDAVEDPAGTLGHAWRSARATGECRLGRGRRTVSIPWQIVHGTAVDAARAARAWPDGAIPRHGATDPGRHRVHLVVVVAADEASSDEALEMAAEATEGMGGATTVVAVTPGSDGRLRADAWVQASLLGLWHSDIEVIAESVDDPVEWTLRSAEGRDGAEVAVVRGPGERIGASGIMALARAGEAGPVSPLALSADGVVSSAGVISRGGHGAHLLAGFPAEDARGLGETIAVAGHGAVTRALPLTPTATAVRTLLTESVIIRHDPPAPAAAGEDTDLDALLGASPLRLDRWTARGPVFTRPPREARLADGTTVPSLRWAIKIAAPAGPEGQAWGDTHFANGIAAALRRLGQEAVVDAYPARDRKTSALDDVALVLRGPRRIDPPAHGRSLLWIISHPDEITAGELSAFDRVFAASVPWAVRASGRLGHAITPLLQCTDAMLFRPAGLPRDEDVVFVGTARGIARPSVVAPIQAGIDVSVYGPDWRRFIPGRFIRASGIPHSELPARYESAAVVLNDHWPAMQAEGFISNRPYDVVAAGGRVISDAVEGLEEHFGGAVRTYDTTEELIGMLRGDLDALFPDAEALEAVSRRIRAEDSFDARARALLAAATDVSAG